MTTSNKWCCDVPHQLIRHISPAEGQAWIRKTGGTGGLGAKGSSYVAELLLALLSSGQISAILPGAWRRTSSSCLLGPWGCSSSHWWLHLSPQAFWSTLHATMWLRRYILPLGSSPPWSNLVSIPLLIRASVLSFRPPFSIVDFLVSATSWVWRRCVACSGCSLTPGSACTCRGGVSGV